MNFDHWNYRVIQFDPSSPLDDPYYGIVEVYYTSDGDLRCYTANPIRVTWEEIGEGEKILARMAKACMLPILKPEDFN